MKPKNYLQVSTPQENSLEDFDGLIDEVLGSFLNYEDGKSPSHSEVVDETIFCEFSDGNLIFTDLPQTLHSKELEGGLISKKQNKIVTRNIVTRRWISLQAKVRFPHSKRQNQNQ